MSEVDKNLEDANVEDEHLEDDDIQEDQDTDVNLDSQEEDDADSQDDDADSDDSEDSEEDEEEERKPSRRESLRIQQLLTKMKEEDGASPKKAKPQLDIDNDLDADEDTKEKIRNDREKYAESRYEEGVERAYRFSRFETRLEVDAPRVEAKYPQLDKDSDDFNPVLASTINKMYLSAVGYDGENRSVSTSDIRYSDYVEAMFELASEIAGVEVEKTATNLKKQASKTGTRPSGSGKKALNLSKAPGEMSDAELDAIIRQSLGK